MHYLGSRWQSGNILASGPIGPGLTLGQGTLTDDSSFHPVRVGELSSSFGWERGGRCSGTALVLNKKVELHQAYGL